MASAYSRGFDSRRRGRGKIRTGHHGVGNGGIPFRDDREKKFEKRNSNRNFESRLRLNPEPLPTSPGNPNQARKNKSSSERSHKPSPLHFNKLKKILEGDSTEAVLQLLKHEEQLGNLLDERELRDGVIELLLEILAKVYDTHMKENLMKIMALFPNTVFLRVPLSRYIMMLHTKRNVEKNVKNIIQFFDEILRRFPDNYSDIPIDSLVVASMTLTLSSDAKALVQDLVSSRQSIIERKSKPRSKVKDNEEEKPPDDFRKIPVHPTARDFDKDKTVFLRKNIIDGTYENVAHYLDVQFRLLREDFIGPLREGVDEIAQGVRRNERNQNLRVYRNVELVDTVCTVSGIVHLIRFDVRRFQRVKWENSKRLIFGTFLCLSSDKFKTLVFATVSERKPEQLKDGFVQVRFLGDLPDVKSGEIYEMVESPGYYEAYCHNLEGLQEISDEKMPFGRYLVQCKTIVNPPKYLTVHEMAPTIHPEFAVAYNDVLPISPRYNLQDVLRSRDARSVQILEPESWPRADSVSLNRSQLIAIQAALTEEFVVIQGPPGTGKTYVGLKIVEALLKNQDYWRRNQMSAGPMLVVCYTNHALDQFLEGILQFNQNDVVRVGGRSDSDSLKPFNLSNKARRTAAWYLASNELDMTARSIKERKNCIQKANERKLKFEDLITVIDEREANQLLPYVYFAEFHGTTVLDAWLNMQHLPFYASNSQNMNEKIDENYVFNTRENDLTDDDDDEESNEEEEDQDTDEDSNEEKEDDEDTDEDSNEEEEDTDEIITVDVEKDAEIITVDVEKDAERLQNERILNDEFAPVQQYEDDIKMHMTQDQLNLVNVQARFNAFEEKQGNGHWQEMRDLSLWELDLNTRLQYYQHWSNLYHEMHNRKLEELYQEYETACRKFKEIKHGQEEDTLRKATVIGMTTTGAAKYRNVLQMIRPKIVIVEEAAEVLEAHIVTALSEGAEHLILIGDHKQLKPNPCVFTLAKQYNLEVSLFERMVRNGMKCHTLDTQHRMRPEIARLMKFIYQDLKNHSSVERFDDVMGISKNIFFINHQEAEQSDDELKSHSNDHEANFIVALCQYLLQQGYSPSIITVLTTYTGQLLHLKRLMPKAKFEGVRLCTVDNFQGEENDIILLSLVRSNEEKKIGFLGISNRICVALSRARKGFYCIGNISMLAEKSNLWHEIMKDLEVQGAIGAALPVYCQNHKNTKFGMRSAQDFKKVPQGGCTLPCDYRLDCGHKCEMVCHPADREHKEYDCKKLCKKEVCPEHQCRRKCHHGEPCGPCREIVTKKLPKCGHEVKMQCGQDPSSFKCSKPCERILECGHSCRATCGEICSRKKCKEIVDRTLFCGHTKSFECWLPIEECKCDEPCGTLLECGHKCQGNCHDCKQGRIHIVCKHPCGRTLICSHPCDEPCTNDCPPCQRKCENRCVHSACGKKCGEPCAPCQEPCTWRCKHKKCTKKCSEICDRRPCNVKCRKKLPCDHRCVGLCGEKCPRLCRICNKDELREIFFGTEDRHDARFIELLDCHHVFEVTALDQWMSLAEEEGSSIQLKACPKCKTPIRKSFRYGNLIKKVLQDIETIKSKVRENGANIEQRKKELKAQLSEISSKYPDPLHPLDQDRNRSSRRPSIPFRRNLVNATSSVFFEIETEINNVNSNQKLDVISYKIQLLRPIYEIKAKFISRLQEKIPLQSQIMELETLVLKCNKLTSQLIADVQQEIQRTALACKLKVLQEDIKKYNKTVSYEQQLKLNAISSLFRSPRKINNDIRESAIRDLDQISQDLQLGAITAEEKAEIVKAMGLTKGHWFKCPNGHIYAIGDCGGAMERAKCPECHAVIGGENHTLEADNQLASEMDGARHPAWSNQVNLVNYDPEELRALQFF